MDVKHRSRRQLYFQHVRSSGEVCAKSEDPRHDPRSGIRDLSCMEGTESNAHIEKSSHFCETMASLISQKELRAPARGGGRRIVQFKQQRMRGE